MSRLNIQSLTKKWGKITGLDRVSFSVPEGSLTVLLGPSGCGKSTILRLIAGLDTATSGSILIGNRDVTGMDPSKRGISMVFQSYALFPHLSVRENIFFGLKVRKIKKSEQKKRLKEAADMVGLSDLLDRRPAQLSGGQRQRVALARSIVSRKKVCLMDEPLSNLDAKLRAEMREEICTLQRRLGLTMIYVTHDQVEAMTMADQVVLLNGGRMVQAGSPKALYDRPEEMFAAKFMGAPPMNLFAFNRGSSPPSLRVAWPPDGPETGFIGVRPEHLTIGRTGLEGEVTGVDYLGSETILKIKYENRSIFVKTGQPTACRAGDPVFLSWDGRSAHRFDTEGRRLPGCPDDKNLKPAAATAAADSTNPKE